MNKHGKCMQQKQQKKKKQKKRKQHKKKLELARGYLETLVGEISPILSDVPEVIVCEILSRLPVKSLMRFKCVCKHWQSIIQNDDFFIDLHLSRSKTVSLLRIGSVKSIKSLISMELLLPSKEDDGRVAPAVGAISAWKFPFPENKCIFCTADGLICVMNLNKYRLRIYNISTIESTPWIESTFIKNQQKENEKQERHRYFSLSKFGLGFDLVTKKHKVIAIWYIGTKGLGFPTYDLSCEVLTVRHNTWRRIEVVDLDLHYGYVESVHVNGFICWLHYHHYSNYEDACIIQFDVGSEKFKKITLPPNPISNDNFRYRLSIINIDGLLAILASGKTSTKMYKFYGKNKESKTGTSSAASSLSCDYYWEERKAFSKPPSNWQPPWCYRTQHIPGTDLFSVGRCTDDHF
ncbi:putative F-box protein At2g02030 [Papaver somniferum]|uniref:putative F-box protein At2g02030 n=1 Tax=Papaver somniferum TaxID=3469 RepID=UPI000E7033F4|nr:putative F-box protein At2g02030 [Papaver somniferum]